MFLVVGKGTYLKDALISKLGEWGIQNALSVVNEAERKGRSTVDTHKILLVR